MKIIVDCNNDKLMFTSNEVVDFEYKIKNPIQIITILSEVFNRLDSSRLAAASAFTFDIQLVKIDEDTIRVVGEW